MRFIKYYLLLIPIMFLFWSCENKKEPINYFKKYLLEGKNPSIRSDTIFMGFCFGQTPKEVEEHFKLLTKQGLITNDHGIYRYELTLDSIKTFYEKLDVTFLQEYFENKLYKFELCISPVPLSGNYSESFISHMVRFDALNILRAKYPNSFWRPNKDSATNEVTSFDLIENNRLINIYTGNYNLTYICYTDISAHAKIEIIEDNKNKQKYIKSKDAL